MARTDSEVTRSEVSLVRITRASSSLFIIFIASPLPLVHLIDLSETQDVLVILGPLSRSLPAVGAAISAMSQRL